MLHNDRISKILFIKYLNLNAQNIGITYTGWNRGAKDTKYDAESENLLFFENSGCQD